MADEHHEEPLSDEEIKALRVILVNEARMTWLRSSVRIWMSWLAGGLITGFAAWKAFSEYFSIKIGVR